MSKFVCPYCLSDYNIKEVKYYCPTCKYDETKPKRSESLPPKCQNYRMKCTGVASDRKCPKCERSIPDDVLRTPNLPFSIVGVPSAGKTAYITVMLHQLRLMGNIFNLSLSHQDKPTMNHQTELRKMIYEDLQPPLATNRGAIMPQIWKITNKARRAKNGHPAYTFTIFDGAGEDHLEEIDVSSTVARYISTSEAIILILDPLTISGVRTTGLVDQKVMQDSLGGDMGETAYAQDIINDIARYIRAMNPKKYRSGNFINIPVAVVMSKFDTVWNHHAFADGLVKNPNITFSKGKINMNEIDQVHQEIIDWLDLIGESDLVSTLEANFPIYKFFGVSSYGSPPKDVGTLNKPDPHRVLDPLLWLFKNMKFID
ncbi:MAG: hypothetical protein FWD01_00095 [Defluviitaleaceae bacterium]|nr:hypothetical protein [Defluviitaleaceae bacterium]